MSRIVITAVSLSLAMILSTAALAQQGGSAGGGSADEPPARVRGGGGAGGFGGGLGKAPAPPERGWGGGGMGGAFAPQPHVQIGIAMDRVPEALAAHLDIEPNEVILIVSVVEGGPADKAGVKRFDIVTHVDGQSPVTQQTIRQVMRDKEPGDEVTLRLLRGGEMKELTVTLAEPPAPRTGAWGNIYYLTPEQQAQMPPLTTYVPPDGRVRSNVFLLPEQTRELRQQFRQQWREHRPEIEEHLRRLREEADALRETLGKEWREEWREFRLDEESREKLGKWLEGAADRTAGALERLAEALEGVKVEVDIQPRIEILREGGGVRGMVIHPDEALRRQVEAAAERARAREWERHAERRRAMEREETEREEVRRPAPEIDRRLNRLEERLERMERMMRRLLERDGTE